MENLCMGGNYTHCHHFFNHLLLFRMNTSIKTFLECTEIGEEVDIATSEYSIDSNPYTGWNPKFRMHHSTIRSMVKKGIVNAEFFWRGATVKRIK